MKVWRLMLALLWRTIRGRGRDTVYIDARGLSEGTSAELDQVSLSATEMGWPGNGDRAAVLVAEPEDREAARFWAMTHPAPMSEDDARPVVDDLTAQVAQLQVAILRMQVESARRNNVTVSEYLQNRRAVLRYEDALEYCRDHHPGGNPVLADIDGRTVLINPTWAEVDAEKRAADQ